MNTFNTPISNYQQPLYPQNPYIRQNNGIIWVQGIEGAKAFQLQPNSNSVLMDSENDGVFYIKVSDNVGMCNLRVFKFEEITKSTTTPVNTVSLEEYVRKEDLKSEVETLVNSILGGQSNEQSVSATKSRKTITQ